MMKFITGLLIWGKVEVSYLSGIMSELKQIIECDVVEGKVGTPDATFVV